MRKLIFLLIVLLGMELSKTKIDQKLWSKETLRKDKNNIDATNII